LICERKSALKNDVSTHRPCRPLRSRGKYVYQIRRAADAAPKADIRFIRRATGAVVREGVSGIRFSAQKNVPDAGLYGLSDGARDF
jgi:hypothetical protein